MDTTNSPNRPVLVFGLAVFMLAPSFDTALKYFGPAGVAAYFIIGTLLICACDRFVFRSAVRMSDRTASILAAGAFVVLAAAAFAVYPIANTGMPGSGSDADDALVIAARDLVGGRYPYTQTTYLGNLISPMPGAILLAIPFALSGAIWLQNIFWLAVFLIVFRSFQKSGASGLVLIAAMLAFSPTLLQNILTGADYASNSIYVLVMMWILVRTIPHDASAEWTRLLPAVLLGVALSSRSTFMLIMPLFLSVLVQTAGWAKAIKYLSIAGVSFLAVTLPFWLYDPAGFAPLKVQSEKLTAIGDIVPFATVILPGSALLIAIVLSFRDLRGRVDRFFLYCGIVQIYVLFVTSLIYSVKLGYLDLFLQQSGYGLFALMFGATGLWIYLYGREADETELIKP